MKRALHHAAAIGLVAALVAFGAPTSPLPFAQDPEYATFDVQLHQRDASANLTPMTAQHGSDCSGPPATHAIGTNAQDHVFICNNHVMTSLNESGYGLIVLTPNRMVDFASQGTVDFDLSTQRMSIRDWWDVTVSPFTEAQPLPLLSDLAGVVDLHKPNRNSIVVTTDNNEGAPNLKVVTNGSAVAYGPPGWAGSPFNAAIVAGTNQAAVRQPFRLTLTPGRVRFERLASATGSPVVFFDRAIPALAWSRGVVQFGHHSYNPTKDGAGVPATWHWSGFTMTPAVPFTITHFPTRATTGGTITANAPAPANAYLRFAAICKPTINGVSPPKMTDGGHPEHFASYMMPIAAGAQTFSVALSADSWYTPGFGCLMKDYSIFALGGVTSTPTPTPVPPTPSPSPTSPPPPTSTASPSPTSTPPPSPSPSPTSTPLTYSCVRSDGTVIWSGDPGGRTCP